MPTARHWPDIFKNYLHCVLGKYPPRLQHIWVAVSKCSSLSVIAWKQFPVAGLHFRESWAKDQPTRIARPVNRVSSSSSMVFKIIFVALFLLFVSFNVNYIFLDHLRVVKLIWLSISDSIQNLVAHYFDLWSRHFDLHTNVNFEYGLSCFETKRSNSNESKPKANQIVRYQAPYINPK